MKKMKLAATFAVAVFISPLTSLAQSSADPHGHDQGTASAPAASAANDQGSASSQNAMESMDAHMKKMQALHEQMIHASTPAERQKAMAEAHREMQAGMTMMMGSPMGKPGPMPREGTRDNEARLDMMERRMDMMQMMMQLMMDERRSMMGGRGAPSK